ncbi:MAG: AAA family ATPase [Bacteroides sp.]|nr:AAA family ATPase [Bacteroides sp.]MCM1548520.1 AAA family ATPase [Clostridium sp.]
MMQQVEPILSKIKQLQKNKTPIRIGIDGRCAAGKTTLAAYLQEELRCSVIHMDDFFLRPEQRTPERYAEPGGNIDYERFRTEVLKPLLQGRRLQYRPFDCHSQGFREPVCLEPEDIVIIEGTYSCHPFFREAYQLRIFLTLEPEEQLRRIRERNGAKALIQFRERWIPLEEAYFAGCEVLEHSDWQLRT